jgi:hypothetical protein
MNGRRVVAALAVAASVTCTTTSCSDGSGSAGSDPGEPAPTATTMAPRAFADAVRAGDLQAIQATFADDIELYSPVMAEPFVGRDRVERLFTVLVDTFEDIEVLDEAESSSRFILFFDARVNGEPLQVVDLLSFDQHGKIETLVVTTRPMAGTQALAEAVAPHLAAIG